MIKKKLLIVIPFFNEQDFLQKSIESVIKNSSSDFSDILLIDDASNDSSYDIALKFANKHDHIIIIRNKTNIGVTESIKNLVDLNKYTYIARHDADDLSLNKRFIKEIDYLERNTNCAVVGTGFYNFNFKTNNFVKVRVSISKFFNKFIFNYVNIINTGTSMWRSSALQSIGGFQKINNKVEGYATISRLLNNGYEAHNIQDICYAYITHSLKMHRSHSDNFKTRNDSMISSHKDRGGLLKIIIWSNLNFWERVFSKNLRNRLIGRRLTRLTYLEAKKIISI